MKNPHGVKPTRYMRRENGEYIACSFKRGPRFGNDDICINGKCNSKDMGSINNNGTGGFFCHPQYKSSLFVNTDKPENRNSFTVLDYEVFGINYESKYTIDHACKHHDAMWEYVTTRDISEQSIKGIGNDFELLRDLDTIRCKDNSIRMKISEICFKNPSELLTSTQIVDKWYDDYLREWLGNDYKWKLIYRASEHGYTAESFHECCDDKGPTLIVVKSTNGCIFGGYTTKHWSGMCIYYNMI